MPGTGATAFTADLDKQLSAHDDECLGIPQMTVPRGGVPAQRTALRQGELTAGLGSTHQQPLG
jgi:hypothetical protein